MNKKGFTLVELLAVIVILAIIALIAIPLIGNVIEKVKIGALESSVNGLVESANMYYANNTIKGETITETIFDFEDGEQISDKKLEYKGKVYNGKLILHANGEVAVCIDDEEHYAYKNKDTDKIVSGNGTCLYDGTTGDFSSNTNNMQILNNYSDDETKVGTWIDGKPLYRISGVFKMPIVDTDGVHNTIGYDVAKDVDIVVDIGGTAINNKGNIYDPLPSTNIPAGTNTVTYIHVWYNVYENKLYLRSSRIDHSGTDAYVTMYYTKTTD